MPRGLALYDDDEYNLSIKHASGRSVRQRPSERYNDCKETAASVTLR